MVLAMHTRWCRCRCTTPWGLRLWKYITKHAELAAIACSAKVFPILAQCLPRCPGVKLVVRTSPICACRC